MNYTAPILALDYLKLHCSGLVECEYFLFFFSLSCIIVNEYTVEPRLTKTPFNEKFKLRRHLTAIFLPVVRQNARVTKSHKYRKIHVNFKFAATEIKKKKKNRKLKKKLSLKKCFKKYHCTVYVRTLINVNVSFSFNV